MIFVPPSTYYTIPRTLYACTLLLETDRNETDVLLATWEIYSLEPPYFPISQSTDNGSTWIKISRVTDHGVCGISRFCMSSPVTEGSLLVQIYVQVVFRESSKLYHKLMHIAQCLHSCITTC
ncbi:uncharacterized protein C8R40DRAFT_796634 [Lentinula edodes]|uniref:uncharacterized protein n=1 Tax=Lentinula edodes TaxID=5353 RepID=UPI001E8D073A|nr:uncharacterized protein C8R40DRAFT_796634 [Lentinula edodes]KAH7868933.1 hypothetical protein C8R40DRAFT_796634 [Lentinula edodes]